MTVSRRGKHPVGRMLAPPRLSDPPEEKADWAECWTLMDEDGNTSFSELRSVLKIGGSADACAEADSLEYAEIEGADVEGEGTDDTFLYEGAVEAAFTEISDRICACGTNIYPFAVSSERIAVQPCTRDSIYTFLLLLSRYGPDAGPKKSEGAKLFEDVCAHALVSFLGGKQGLADAQVFGFPRRVSPSGFANALDELCQQLGEGEGNKRRPTTTDQKDAKLDIAAWKSFHDKRKGRLIFFGQCATGSNWRDKRTELIASYDWCTKWMKDRPLVWPIRAFFVPHRIAAKDWFDTCVDGGLLFDRCRIASHSAGLAEGTAREIAEWSKYVVESSHDN